MLLTPKDFLPYLVSNILENKSLLNICSLLRIQSGLGKERGVLGVDGANDKSAADLTGVNASTWPFLVYGRTYF